MQNTKRKQESLHKCFPKAHKKDVYDLFKEPGAAVDVDEFSDMVGEEVTTVLDVLSNIHYILYLLPSFKVCFESPPDFEIFGD